MATTFQLASKFKTTTHVGNFNFVPGQKYNDKSYPLQTPQLANAFANGILVFTDSTSLTEVQSNPLVAQHAADDARANGATAGATSATPKLQLASSVKHPMSFGPYTLTPGKVYTDVNLKINDPNIIVGIARGFITFADGTNVVTFLQDPLVQEAVKDAENDLGFFGTNNSVGATIN